jgi:ssDNA-binding replication factor A large subunit
MIGLTYEQIVSKIKEEKGLPESEIEGKIKKKLEQLSDLISKEGAAHIVANEYGVKLMPTVQQRKAKVGELMPMMRGVEIIVKLIRLYEVRSFKNDKREGKVGSFLAGDESGMVRIVLWDEKLIGKMESGELKEEMVLKLTNGYVKENINGFKEFHMGSGCEMIINPEGETVGEVKSGGPTAVAKKIIDLQESETATLTGIVVQVFDPRFYEACPECNKKLQIQEGQMVCGQHGAVERKFVPIINIYFDDATDNIRVVFFRDQAADLLGISMEELVSIKDNPSAFEDVKAKVLGKQMQITGRVTKNEMFGRLEFMANSVQEANPKEIAAKLQAKEPTTNNNV